MAFDNLFFRTKSEIGGIAIDGSISESVTRSVRATTNPIENGSNITDHIIQEPIKVIVEGVVTDTPIGMAAFTSGSASTIGGVVDSVSGLFGQSTQSGLTRSQQAYNELVKIFNKKELIEITTRLETYTNLIFESIVVNQTKTTSRSVFFTASFVEALIVLSTSSIVDGDNITLDDNAANLGEFENGGNASTTVANATSESSAAASLGSQA